MRDHIPQCWGEEIWNNAKDLELDPAKEIIHKSRTMKNVKLTEMLARLPGSKETFLLSPPSREEIRYVPNLPLLCLLTSFPSVTIARWVSKSMCPFRIVKDRGLRWLCKTGRPHFYLPDETTVAKNVKFFYSWSEHQLAEELQVNCLNDIPCITLTSSPIELQWLSCLPTRLLDVAESPCLHEHFHNMDPKWQSCNDYPRLYRAPEVTHWTQYGAGIGKYPQALWDRTQGEDMWHSRRFYAHQRFRRVQLQLTTHPTTTSWWTR